MNANDPRLTAHALGESDSESAEFISRDAALQAEAEDIRRLADALRGEFGREPAHPLRPEQREAIFAASVVVENTRWWQHGWALASAAAAVVLSLGATIYFQIEHLNSLRPVAESTAPAPQPRFSVRLENTPAHPEAPSVISLNPGKVAAQPTYQRPQPETVAVVNEDAPLPPSSVQRPPTLVTASPAPEVFVDPASVPMLGSPLKVRKPAAIQNRAAARPASTPEKR